MTNVFPPNQQSRHTSRISVSMRLCQVIHLRNKEIMVTWDFFDATHHVSYEDCHYKSFYA